MATVTILEIADAIDTVLGAATGIRRSQSLDELSEGINDMPLLQVYWASLNKTPSEETESFGFGSSSITPLRITEYIFYVDVIVCPRSHLAQNHKKIAEIADAIDTALEAESEAPYFSQTGIKAYDYDIALVHFDDVDPIASGIRVTLTITVF